MTKKARTNKPEKKAKKDMPESDIPTYPDDARELLGKFTANYINISAGFNDAAAQKPQKS